MTAAVLAMIMLPLIVAATLLFTSWAEKTLLREDAARPVPPEPTSATGVSG